MTISPFKIMFILTVVVLLLAGDGCDQKEKNGSVSQQMARSRAAIESGTTIGELVDIISPDFIPVQGYSIVGGLAGTGSADCPPQIRNYLRRYILRHLPSGDVEGLISSSDTAAVLVEALMPIGRGKGARFDVRVTAPESTQTTSLANGVLYGVDLRAAGAFSTTAKVLATAAGPVYIDKIEPAGDERIGYVLSGGQVLDDYQIMLSLRKPDFLVASAIRNKIIESFGSDAAKALSAGQIEVKVPSAYTGRKDRFISLIKATALNLSGQVRKERIDRLIEQLKTSGDKYEAEVGLEAIGNVTVGPVSELLDSADLQVRFHAARCLLNLGSDKGLDVLRRMAFDDASNYRMEAMEAVAAAADRSDAAGLCRRLLRDEDVEIRLKAYELLRRMNDIAIADESIGGKFLLEQIALTDRKMIFVARSGRPRIALFGGPLYCRQDLFIQSEDESVTLNAPEGQEYVTVIRKVPGKTEIPPVTMNCSYEVSDIIKTLGAEPVRERKTDPLGLGVPYCEIISILKRMVEKGALDCQFRAGPMPQITLK